MKVIASITHSDLVRRLVADKCRVFQDDLADDDIMILDSGDQVFLWLGSRCSEVEVKLAYKSAQVSLLLDVTCTSSK